MPADYSPSKSPAILDYTHANNSPCSESDFIYCTTSEFGCSRFFPPVLLDNPLSNYTLRPHMTYPAVSSSPGQKSEVYRNCQL